MLFFHNKKKETYVYKSPEEIQDLIRKADEKIQASLDKQKIEAIKKAHEEYLKVLPILNELNLNKLVEMRKNNKITEEEFTEYSDKLLDLQNKLR